jgi:hypothetical protein
LLPFLLGEAQETRMYTMALVWLAAVALVLGIERMARIRDRPQRAPAPAPALVKDRGPGPLLRAGPVDPLRNRLCAGPAVGLGGDACTHCPAAWSSASAWIRLKPLLFAGLLTVVLCLPGLPVALRQIPGYRNPNLVVPPVGHFLAELARVYSLGEHFDPVRARPWMLALAVLLVGGWLAALTGSLRHVLPGTRKHAERVNGQAWQTNRRQSKDASDGLPGRVIASRRPYIWLALLWAVLPLLIYYLVISDRATAATRYISVALPGWLLFAGLALAGWARLHRGLGGPRRWPWRSSWLPACTAT